MKKATGKFAAAAGVASACVLAVYGSTRLLADIQSDRPTPLQIDGETIRNVKNYQVVSAKRNAATQESVCTAI